MVKAKKRKSSGSTSEEPMAKVEAEETGDVKKQEAKVELSPAEQKLKNFAKYYKENALVDAKEWNTFLQINMTPPPVSFRFLQSHRIIPSYMDTVPGIPSQADTLCEYMKNKYQESLGKLTVETKKQVKLEPLEWYPDELGWSLNMPLNQMEKYLGLKEFDQFLNSEKNMNTLQRLETWSMLPPLLLGIKPTHYVLDLCASPGFIAGQVSEMMHEDPTQDHNGLLVLNDLYKLTDKMQYRWTQGSKVVFTNNDARTYPELYSSKEQKPAAEIQFDRVICDVRCSNDGTMRKNTGIQEQWASKAALEYHSEQKKILKRAMELVKVRGLVLYCTTSYNPVENEAVLMSIIKESEGTVELFDCRKQISGFKYRPGLTTWKVMTDEGVFFENYAEASEAFQAKYPESVFPAPAKEAKAFHMERCIRVVPQDNDTAGFFCAVLVKTSEMPAVKARRKAELEAIKGRSQEEPKQYGFRIRLKCNVALDEIEWTTELTNDKLETTSTTALQKFDSPPLEIDPHCMPQRLVDGTNEDLYKYCETTTSEWLKIKSFFKISDDFDPTNMIVRNRRSDFFMSTPNVKNLIHNNRERGVINFAPNVGVRVFHRMPRLWIPVSSPCEFMMTNQGLAYLYPYIGKQLVTVTKEDILLLAFNEKLRIDQLSETAQEEIKETEQGCVLFQYKPANSDAVPQCNITFVGARGNNYIIDFKEGISSLEKKTLFRLCGMDIEDYRRKIQEEKLAKALEKEKAKEAAKDDKVEISVEMK